jgi:Na+-translocating ferredoxin:NAD+ oxidoreductase RnfC subunit
MELKRLVAEAGIIGAGGAGFPSHAKLAEGADVLALNCAECEPLIYTDYMLMREHLSTIARGATLVMDAAGIAKTLLCVKAHRAEMLGMEEGDEIAPRVFVKLLPDAYPMGDEINLIYEATGRVVKPGQLPITAGVIVLNGESAYNIALAVDEGKPVTEKWVTIGGNIENRVVVRVPVGMRVADLFRTLNITVPEGHTVLDGGPSMGRKIRVATAVIGKTTKSLLILPDEAPAIAHKNISIPDMLRRAASCCCGCSRCTEMCPRHLLGYPIEPHKMIRAANNDLAKRNPELIKTASLCCSCGVCAEVCCQDISPKDVILSLKGILAQNKMRFVAGEEEYKLHEDREHRLIPSARWEVILGVKKFDVVPVLSEALVNAARVEIPMSGHIGAPSVPSVQVGETVQVGDVIATPAAGLSMPQHASIAGKVTYVDDKKIIIENK